MNKEIETLPSCLDGFVRGPAKMSKAIRFWDWCKNIFRKKDIPPRSNHEIIYTKNGEILEAVGKGIIKQPLRKYLGRQFEVWLYEYDPMTEEQRTGILGDCKEKKGWWFYDYFATIRHICPILTEMKWAKNCVELAITIFRDHGVPKCPNKKPYEPTPSESQHYNEEHPKWKLVFHHRGNKV